ncbi:LysR family transcriptional regulator [Mesorhizobium newzealandense]|uniref:LysR family transcriptional regulator n=1 Tax=Mesorhizobium newzealandense TaxID=1300302 RepID=A0ABW4UF06_9HYPH
MEGIDLRRLRYFIAVCEHGGFSRASQSIGVAQPSLTRQIKLLEKEVGISLINRSGRGAEPTAEGRFLLGQSRLHIDGLDHAVREVRQRSDKLKGEISLGICPTIVPLFLEDIRNFVEAQYQGVTLNVVEAYSGDLASLMRGGPPRRCAHLSAECAGSARHRGSVRRAPRAGNLLYPRSGVEDGRNPLINDDKI